MDHQSLDRVSTRPSLPEPPGVDGWKSTFPGPRIPPPAHPPKTTPPPTPHPTVPQTLKLGPGSRVFLSGPQASLFLLVRTEESIQTDNM